MPSGTAGSQDQSLSASLLSENEKQSGFSASQSSESAGSEFSDWSDTGDLGEQGTGEDDPLRRQLGDFDSKLGRSTPRRGRREKRVRYQLGSGEHGDKRNHSGFRKEDIKVPIPKERRISRFEHALATMMSRGERQMNGLTGRPLVYFTSIFVSLGVFLFGYDQGVMSGIITGPIFQDYFHKPNAAEIGTMVAILEVGAFISSLIVGRLGDIIGRRRTILYGSLIFFIGGALQTMATTMALMMLGRIIAGFGVGMLSTIVPVYQSEISPPHNRGKLACIEFSGNIIGYATSVWVDYFCSFIDNDYSWRVPLSMQCVMGGLLALGSLIIVESPRWLLDNDHDEEGMVVIANLYGEGDIHNAKARDEFREIKMNVLLQRQEGERSYSEMFKRYRARVFIAMSAQAFAQLNGINVISYYAPLVFISAGWIGRDAILMTGINAITYFLSTIPPWYLVDRLGRRPILLSGSVMMALSLSAIAYFLHLDIKATPTLVVTFVMIYNAAFGYSWGPIPWLYPPEILPLSIRSKGASLSTACNWFFNFIVGEITPILQETISWRLYLMHALFCATSFVVVYFVYPETRGVRLEDMDILFNDATSSMPTPATRAETGYLVARGSPIPSMDLRRDGGSTSVGGGLGSSMAIPGLNIDPPSVDIRNGVPHYSADRNRGEGIGGWISRMTSRATNRDSGSQGGTNSRYKPLDQEEEE